MPYATQVFRHCSRQRSVSSSRIDPHEHTKDCCTDSRIPKASGRKRVQYFAVSSGLPNLLTKQRSQSLSAFSVIAQACEPVGKPINHDEIVVIVWSPIHSTPSLTLLLHPAGFQVNSA